MIKGLEEAQQQHDEYWSDWASQLTKANLQSRVCEIAELVGLAVAGDPQSANGISENLSLLAHIIGHEHPQILCALVPTIPEAHPVLKPYSAALLGVLYSVDRKLAVETSRAWTRSGDQTLVCESLRSLLWIPEDQFTNDDVSLVKSLAVKGIPVHVVSFKGPLHLK